MTKVSELNRAIPVSSDDESSAFLHTGAQWNQRDGILDEVEKNRFIVMPS